jgi:hypothetical protein
VRGPGFIGWHTCVTGAMMESLVQPLARTQTRTRSTREIETLAEQVPSSASAWFAWPNRSSSA